MVDICVNHLRHASATESQVTSQVTFMRVWTIKMETTTFEEPLYFERHVCADKVPKVPIRVFQGQSVGIYEMLRYSNV
jgi:hypothetical protein